jgi:REP element-mobilizing transposase RayT
MARHPRFDLPRVAQHIVQRGNNRQACFACDADYGGYLRDLAEAALRHRCAIHAYVLMTNHVHLLATPADAGAISQMMQAPLKARNLIVSGGEDSVNVFVRAVNLHVIAPHDSC